MTLRSSATTSRKNRNSRPKSPTRSSDLTLVSLSESTLAFLTLVAVPPRRVVTDSSSSSSASTSASWSMSSTSSSPASSSTSPRSSSRASWPRRRLLCAPSPSSVSRGWLVMRCALPPPAVPCHLGSAGTPSLLSSAAGATGLEPATCGFGDRCATNCATPLCVVATPGTVGQGLVTPRPTSLRVSGRNSQAGTSPQGTPDRGPGLGKHLLTAAHSGQVEDLVPLGRRPLHHGAHGQLGALVGVGYHHRPGEPHLVLDDRARVTGPLGHRAGDEGHREHAVRDHAGQPDARGDAVTPVDRAEVPGRPRVPDEAGTGDPVRAGGQLHGAHSPRTTNIVHAVTTGSPSSVAMSVRAVRKSLPTRDVISSIVVVQTSRSPARTGRV